MINRERLTDYFFCFFGLPIWTSRIFSSADLSYRTARVIGSIPAFWSRLRTLSGLILRTFAISSRVYPSISIISEYSRVLLENLLKFRIFYLTKQSEISDTILISVGYRWDSGSRQEALTGLMACLDPAFRLTTGKSRWGFLF